MMPDSESLPSYSLVDQVGMAGPYAKFILISSLILWMTGGILIFIKPALTLRRAHLAACFLPAGLGVLSFVTSFMGAFASLSAEEMQNGTSFILFLGQASLAPSFSFIGTGIALILTGFLWLRGEKPAP